MRAALRHALPSLIECSIGPAALFYLVLSVWGMRGALIAALAWSYLAAGRRLVRHERIPALLGVGLTLLTARSAVSFATGSAVVYFAQPMLGTVLVALLFLGSALVDRPLVERLAHDFCPLDHDVMRSPSVRRFFLRISFLWAVVLLVNTGFVLWLLLVSSLSAFVLERTAVTWTLTGAGIALSTRWFLHVMRQAGVTVRFGAHAADGARAVGVAAD